MKKLIYLLLVLVLVISLVACGKDNSKHDADVDTDTTTQKQPDVTNEETPEQNTEETTSDTTDDSESTDVTESTTNTPDSVTTPETTVAVTTGPNTPIHTHTYSAATCTTAAKCSCGATNGSALGHSYSAATCTAPAKCSRCGVTNGTALGHSWKEATCQAPKTCSGCQITEGNTVDHIVEGTTCKWCKQVVVVSPALLKNRQYKFYKLIDYPFENESLYGTIALYRAYVDFSQNYYQGHMYHEGELNPNYPDEAPRPIYYNNKYYFPNTGDSISMQKSISDNRIVVMLNDHNVQGSIEFELLSNDTLKVVSMTNIQYDPCIFNFSVGDIFA